MVDEPSGGLGACAWCNKEAVVVHLNFSMCGTCFADTSVGFHDKVGSEEWLTGLPRDVVAHIIRGMLRHARAATT